MTITCASERSGMASMLLLRIAQMPAPTSIPVSSNTSSLFRIENSMSLAIMLYRPFDASPHVQRGRSLAALIKQRDQLVAEGMELGASCADVFDSSKFGRRVAQS